MFRAEWDNWSKLDRLGFIFGSLLLVSFLIGLFCYVIFTDELSILATSHFFYFVIIMLGIFRFADIYYNVVALFFFPDSSSEKIVKEKRKEYKRIYPIKLAKLKLEQFKIKLKLKDVDNDIRFLNNNIRKEHVNMRGKK